MAKEIKRPRLRKNNGKNLPEIDTSAPELSEREFKLFRAVTEGRTLAQAAEEAGYSMRNPTQSGYDALKNIKRKIADVMDENGLSVDELIKSYLKPMMNATEVKVFKANGVLFQEEEKDKDGNITQERIMQDGGVIYSDPLVAWGPRKDGLDMSFKIHGAYQRPDAADSAQNITNNSLTIINHIERPKREKLGPDVN